jgi:hypothetical protein
MHAAVRYTPSPEDAPPDQCVIVAEQVKPANRFVESRFWLKNLKKRQFRLFSPKTVVF